MFVIPGNKRAPFIRLVIPLIAGIVLQLYGSWSLSSLLQMTGFTIVCLCLYCYLPLSFRFLYGWIQGVLLYLLIGCCGALLLYQSDVRRQKSYFGTIINDSSRLVLRIEESLEEKPHSWKTTATITGILSGNRRQPAKGTVLLYFAKDSTPPDLQYGHQLLLANILQPVSRSGNPGVFDYRQYCAYQQIYYQAYLQRKDWYKLPEHQGNVFMQLVLHCRHYCLTILKKYIGNGPEGGMAQALLIGYRQELDKTMVQTYTNTGIVHIIAISGMHVGLIYISLVWLLQWLPINTATRLIKAMLLILLLWSFAFLTGGAAAVLRAVVTFTALAIGKFLLERDSSSYNTLAASAFLLLCYNPHFITDVGFVLSYLAVLGILLFYKPIYDAWSVKNQWLDKLWKIVALSLAAQILTLPACLFYFHQFPNYFLLANIVAVPLSSLIIYGEILLLLFAGIPGVAVYLGIGVKYLIVLMNTWVAWLNELPYGLVENIHINSYQTICMYLFLAALAAWYFYKWKKGLHVALTMLLLCSLLHVVNIIQSSQQRKIIIYNVPKYTAIDFIVGHSVHFAGDTSLWQTAVAQQLHTTRSYLRVSTGRIPQLAQVGGYFRFGQKQLVVIDRPLPGKPVDKKFRTDYILLSHNPKVAIKQLSDFFEFDYLIFDASNSFWKIQQWKNDCYALTLRCFSVPDQGAYVINF